MALFLKYLFFSLIIVFVIDRYIGTKYDNKYPCYGIFGKPGAGKTLLLTYLAWYHIKRGWVVYVDFPCKIDGIKHFDDLEFKSGKWLPDGRINNENILMLFDEMGTIFNNRDFRTNFANPDVLKWWSEHRHRQCKIYWASQGWKNPDLRIRESLTDGFYLCSRSILRTFVQAKPIMLKTDILNNESGENTGGQIVDFYKFAFFIQWKFLFMPKWVNKFNSFA